jgi:hypothetical protein
MHDDMGVGSIFEMTSSLREGSNQLQSRMGHDESRLLTQCIRVPCRRGSFHAASADKRWSRWSALHDLH